MQINELITEIAGHWGTYHAKGRVDSNDPIYDSVVRQFPMVLDQHLAAFDTVLIEGSTGRGNITDSPWSAVFDGRLTTNATREYYVVYLFSVDMISVTLCLAFGTMQFKEQFRPPSQAFPRMRAAASRLQQMYSHLIPAHVSLAPT